MNTPVPKNLKKLREAARYTQDDVSKILNITRSAYSNYESGEREIPINILERISDFFGCEMAVFYENDINADSLILTSAFRLDGLTEADTEEIIRFKRIVKSYLKMQRLDDFSQTQKMNRFLPIKPIKSALFNVIDRYTTNFRQQVGLSDTEAVNLKSLLLKLNILTIYRPLSNSFSGMSLRGYGNERFMLINSNQPRCRQHFTIAHELFHLYLEENPMPHKCEIHENKDISEQYADAFAQRFLMPYNGILQLISDDELATRSVSLATVIRLEHYFSVSRQAMIYRLYDLKFLSREQREVYLSQPVISSAKDYGYSTYLYRSGNDGLVIGDYGEKARKLFEAEKISEGHYYELMNNIGIDDAENQDSPGC